MQSTIRELEVVALLKDWPEANLCKGQVGTVVEVLDDEVYLVEFSGDDGRTFALEPLPGDALLTLHYKPATG